MFSNVEYSQSSGFYHFALANAVFSALCAIIILSSAQWLPEWLNLANSLTYYLLAGGLFLFASRLFMIVKTKRVMKVEAWAIVAGDLLWVAGSVFLLSLESSVTSVGFVVISAIALAVFLFALGQWHGLSRNVIASTHMER